MEIVEHLAALPGPAFTRDERYRQVLWLALSGYQLLWAPRFFNTVA